MAQLVARLVRNEKVGGSNPPSSTTSKVCPARKLAGQTFSGYRRERVALGGVSWGSWVCPAQPLRRHSPFCGVELDTW